MIGAPRTRHSIFLVGFMGAGKSTVGRILAQRLGWAFYDLDVIIEAREHATVANIFAQAGEPRFRELERKALAGLLENELQRANAVVGLGGGAFAQPENRKVLQSYGARTVLLNAPIEELRRRCNESGGQRPLAGDAARFEQLFEDRRAAYRLADFHVETGGKSVEDVAGEIERWIDETETDRKNRKLEVRQ
ncbi:MAG TPA: shikimate kinase [Candidatus Angelobacter sp.]|jgi:shikimate kinase|nr:shikimate kinase [Candidatus Angelobacter sp.]